MDEHVSREVPVSIRRSRYLAIAALAVSSATTLSTYLLIHNVNHAAGTITTFMQPHVNVTTILASSVTAMRFQVSLIVEEADITAEVTKSESYYWWKIYFGTTTARVRALGCRVEYVIPLDSFSDKNIEAVITGDGEKILRVSLPEPRVNENIVQIDYQNIEIESASAWARFNKQDVADQARSLLRQAAIDEAKKPWHLRAVEADAERAVRRLLTPLLRSLQSDVKLEISFH